MTAEEHKAPLRENTARAVEDHVSEWKPRWQCIAKQHRIVGAEVQDCDWPVCGCDPYADKVLDAMTERGFKIVKENT